MGRRSRKRTRTGSATGGDSRAQRDAAREIQAGPSAPARQRARRGRPQAPWGSFPLTELVVLLGLVLAAVGFVVGVGDGRGRAMFVAGLALAALGGLETAVRDHFAGYRSHTTLLAGALAVAAVVALTVLLGFVAPSLPISITLVGGAIVFAAAFGVLRRAFQNRSGGLSFR